MRDTFGEAWAGVKQCATPPALGPGAQQGSRDRSDVIPSTCSARR